MATINLPGGGVIEEGGAVKPSAAARKITRFAFRMRFTLAERAAIDLASLDDPTAAAPVRAAAATLRTHQQDLANATFVDLDRADIVAGLALLEGAGLIAAGRADEIMGDPVQPDEVYDG